MILLTLTYSCNPFKGCEKINVDKNQLEWIKEITDGDTLIFKSIDGKTRKFLVNHIQSKYSDCNKIELSPYVYQSLGLKMTPLKGSDIKDSCFSILLYEHYLTDNNKWSNKAINVFGYFVGFDDETNPKLKIDTLFLSDKLKIQTYYFTSSDSLNPFSPKGNYVKNFHWSKKYGLVRFETLDNENFELELD